MSSRVSRPSRRTTTVSHRPASTLFTSLITCGSSLPVAMMTGHVFIRLYELPDPESPLTADQHKHEANVPETGKKRAFDAHVFRRHRATQPNDRVGDFLLVSAPADGK